MGIIEDIGTALGKAFSSMLGGLTSVVGQIFSSVLKILGDTFKTLWNRINSKVKAWFYLQKEKYNKTWAGQHPGIIWQTGLLGIVGLKLVRKWW